MREIKERLARELQALEYEFRVELPREIRTAVEMGDLRENAEYKAALERQAFGRARFGYRWERRASVNTLNLQQIPKDRTGLGSVWILLALAATCYRMCG